jgi:hypothetical protein
MADFWRGSIGRFDEIRNEGEHGAAYAAGWTISGLATLGVIVAVWIFGV